MYHLVKALYQQATSKEEYSILLLGLDNSGKTTLLSAIKSIYSPEHPSPLSRTIPTVGQNVSVLSLPDMYLRLWDVGGQHSLRRLWQSYYRSCHAIIFVLDSTDIGNADISSLSGEGNNDQASKSSKAKISSGGNALDSSGRLEECKVVLESILSEHDVAGVPILVLANKQDLEDCVETVRIKDGLVRPVFEGAKGGSVRDSRVLPISALHATGVQEAMDWVTTRVKLNKEERPPVRR